MSDICSCRLWRLVEYARPSSYVMRSGPLFFIVTRSVIGPAGARPWTADEVIVIAEGTVRARGTHAELLRRDSGYRDSLWRENQGSAASS